MRDVYLTNDSREWAHITDQRKHKTLSNHYILNIEKWKPTHLG